MIKEWRCFKSSMVDELGSNDIYTCFWRSIEELANAGYSLREATEVIEQFADVVRYPSEAEWEEYFAEDDTTECSQELDAF